MDGSDLDHQAAVICYCNGD